VTNTILKVEKFSPADSRGSGRLFDSSGDAPDKKPVHIFLVLVAPPYDDRLYLKLYKEAGELFLRDEVMQFLLKAKSTTDIMNFFRAPDRLTDGW